MAVKGIDLLVSRRRANVSALELARQMGVTRQYVAKLEGRDDVTPEAAEMYRRALSALEDDRLNVTIEVDEFPPDYRVAGRKVRGRLRHDDPAKTAYTVVVQPNSNWQTVLAVLDSIALRGSRSKVVVAGGEGEPTVLPRLG